MNGTMMRRFIVLAIAVLIFLGVYGLGRHYSPSIVAYVVKHALMQKAPVDLSPKSVEERFEEFLASTPADDKLLKLLSLSNYLEKVQKLTPAEFERLMAAQPVAPAPGL